MLPLILLVWGVVFSQLFSYFFSSPSYAVETKQESINIDEIKQDTFSIVANYRDPFLGGKIKFKQRSNSSASTRKKLRKSIQVKAEKSWPLIAYNGMIKNNNSKRRVGIIRIDGKEYLIKEKDVVSEVTILSINKHEVNVRFQKEKKTITK